jgi:hypothetical protein
MPRHCFGCAFSQAERHHLRIVEERCIDAIKEILARELHAPHTSFSAAPTPSDHQVRRLHRRIVEKIRLNSTLARHSR